MRRRILTIASAVSLLLFVGTAIIWLGEFQPALAVGNHYVTADIQTHDAIYVSVWEYTFDVKEVSRIDRPFIRFSWDNWMYFSDETVGYDGKQFAIARTRFFGQPGRRGLWMSRYFVKCPYWFVIGVCAILPLRWMMLRRVPPGHCACCGYNLTGNMSGVCPECGAAVVRPAPASPPLDIEAGGQG